MEILDADEIPLRDSKGKIMSRDIVQFVNYRNLKDNTHEFAK
jgi:hypothetical protein